MSHQSARISRSRFVFTRYFLTDVRNPGSNLTAVAGDPEELTIALSWIRAFCLLVQNQIDVGFDLLTQFVHLALPG